MWKTYRRSKYHSRKIEVDGQKFDSMKEYQRYNDLRILEKAGKIIDLRRQVHFQLIPGQREPDKAGPRGGVIRGKVIERPVEYIADFVYTDGETGEIVVEDVKGMRTEVYKIKRKLMLYKYGIKILET